MDRGCWLAKAIATVSVLAGSNAFGQTAPIDVVHLRPDSAAIRQLIDDLVERTPTGRALIERLNASDLTVYIRCRNFGTTSLRGRTGMLESSKPTRVLLVEIAIAMPTTDRLVYLAHELQHAVEIAEAPDVVSPQTLAQLYQRIGHRTHRGAETFETSEAVEVAEHVRHELMTIGAAGNDDR